MFVRFWMWTVMTGSQTRKVVGRVRGVKETGPVLAKESDGHRTSGFGGGAMPSLSPCSRNGGARGLSDGPRGPGARGSRGVPVSRRQNRNAGCEPPQGLASWQCADSAVDPGLQGSEALPMHLPAPPQGLRALSNNTAARSVPQHLATTPACSSSRVGCIET